MTAFPLGQLNTCHDRELRKKKEKLLTGIARRSPGKYKHVECCTLAWGQAMKKDVRNISTDGKKRVIWGWTIIKSMGSC